MTELSRLHGMAWHGMAWHGMAWVIAGCYNIEYKIQDIPARIE